MCVGAEMDSRNIFSEHIIFGINCVRKRLIFNLFKYSFSYTLFALFPLLLVILEIFLLGAHIVVVSASKQIKLNVHNDNNMGNTNPHKIHLIWFDLRVKCVTLTRAAIQWYDNSISTATKNENIHSIIQYT